MKIKAQSKEPDNLYEQLSTRIPGKPHYDYWGKLLNQVNLAGAVIVKKSKEWVIIVPE